MVQHAELVSFGICENLEGFRAGLADIGTRRAQLEQTLDLTGSVGGDEIEMTPVLRGLGSGARLQPDRRSDASLAVGLR